MKKNLRLMFVAALAMIGFSNAMAEEWTIDFNAMNVAVSSSDSQDGDITTPTTFSDAAGKVSIVVSPADEGKTANRFWNTNKGPQLRMYSGTIKINGTNLKSITFDNGKWNDGNTASVGTLSAGVWSSETAQNEITITIAGNTQINKIVFSSDATEPEPQPQPVETTGQGTLDSPYTCADAIAVANALGAGNTSSDKFYIKGKISTITYQFDAEHGTATFNISDNGQAANEFTCYGVYYLENKSWVEGNKQIAVGDEVIIYGNIMLYKNNTTEELIAETASKKAYIYSLNGQTKNEVQPEPVHFTGNGTQSNPYLVSDVRQMTEDIYPADYVWVKGIIIGSANSKTALHAGTAEDADVASNIAIAVSATDTDFTPVQLAANSDFRAKLNVLDNPANKGKEVLICGKIANYFSTAGVKELQTVIFNGETITGITTVTTDAIDVNAPAYNIAGQRVNQGYRGLVIKGGKKVINK
jgi:hypothetical protein